MLLSTASTLKKHIVIKGVGLIGCEFANDLIASGFAVAVVDPSASPIAALLPAGLSEELRQAFCVERPAKQPPRRVDQAGGLKPGCCAGAKVKTAAPAKCPAVGKNLMHQSIQFLGAVAHVGPVRPVHHQQETP